MCAYIRCLHFPGRVSIQGQLSTFKFSETSHDLGDELERAFFINASENNNSSNSSVTIDDGGLEAPIVKINSTQSEFGFDFATGEPIIRQDDFIQIDVIIWRPEI